MLGDAPRKILKSSDYNVLGLNILLTEFLSYTNIYGFKPEFLTTVLAKQMERANKTASYKGYEGLA